jgi:hypothetical protein
MHFLIGNAHHLALLLQRQHDNALLPALVSQRSCGVSKPSRCKTVKGGSLSGDAPSPELSLAVFSAFLRSEGVAYHYLWHLTLLFSGRGREASNLRREKAS